MAQSIGGGGGDGGITVKAGRDDVGRRGQRAQPRSRTSGGAAGGADDVTVDEHGAMIMTTGASSNGIEAQSVGGGGGNGGLVASGSATPGYAVGFSFGGRGGNGGDSGDVTVTNSSRIVNHRRSLRRHPRAVARRRRR